MQRDSNSISRTERLLLRCLLGPAMNWPSLHPAAWTQRLRGERAKLMRLWQRLAQESARCERRRIRRLPGLEEISCDWSAAMVMEHLYLVGVDVETVLQALTTEHSVPQKISVARVKPVRNETDAYDGFMRHLDGFIHRAEQSFPTKSERRWPHPWFGKLSAQGWLRFYYFHLYLHRCQLERIGRSSKAETVTNAYRRFRPL